MQKHPLPTMLDHPRQKAFGEAKWYSLPHYCLDCEVLDMCNGECPKNRFTLTPTGEPGLNYLCEGYRYFFNHCSPFVSEVARLWGDERLVSQLLP
ncbi:MAG: SPASM domain-containing protein [Marinilabiliales bacterium]|nr:SPASM domain-containing protein [Marinilabiliales bacterium]